MKGKLINLSADSSASRPEIQQMLNIKHIEMQTKPENSDMIRDTDSSTPDLRWTNASEMS